MKLFSFEKRERALVYNFSGTLLVLKHDLFLESVVSLKYVGCCKA